MLKLGDIIKKVNAELELGEDDADSRTHLSCSLILTLRSAGLEHSFPTVDALQGYELTPGQAAYVEFAYKAIAGVALKAAASSDAEAGARYLAPLAAAEQAMQIVAERKGELIYGAYSTDLDYVVVESDVNPDEGRVGLEGYIGICRRAHDAHLKERGVQSPEELRARGLRTVISQSSIRNSGALQAGDKVKITTYVGPGKGNRMVYRDRMTREGDEETVLLEGGFEVAWMKVDADEAVDIPDDVKEILFE